MPLHGKIVVIKRSGGDGTEFPLMTSCLFGRKPDCDIRIQIAQVSKEHCRIDLNENKEVILTNLSSVNPTRVNGEALQQSERLKHGDIITILDRSFRFEYPPGPTPNKFAKEVKTETPKPHLQDGTNHNIQRSLEADVVEPSKTMSPFSDLYQMIRKSLDVKTPRKSSGNIHTSKNNERVSTTGTPKTGKAGADGAAEAATPKSHKRRRDSARILVSDTAATPVKRAESVSSEAASPQTRKRTPPPRFSVSEVIEQITATPKSPMRRRSNEATPAKHQEEVMQKPNGDLAGVARNAGPKIRRSADHVEKKKRVSFGGYLVPELFDRKLPPNSPIRKGDTPRRSLCLTKSKQSLLRRASVIGLQNVADVIGSSKASSKKSPKGKSQSPGKKTPKLSTPSPNKKSAKSGPASPKGHSSGKKSPKSKTPSPKMPKSTPGSPKGASPGKKSPEPITPSAKASPPGEKSPKPKTSSPKASGNMSPKSSTPRRTSSSSDQLETPMTKKKRTSLRPTPQENVIETPKAKPPLGSQTQTSSVQGRFSVSRIQTPSPIAEDGVAMMSPTVTPKIPPRRKSLKSTSRRTPSLARSAAKVMLRRSGISRASMKVMSAWAYTVKFGQAKVPAVAPAKNVVKCTSNARKVTKKNLSKLQTPVRKPLGHVSTGHANSPVTIIVGRAVKQNALPLSGAAPKVIFSTAISKKDLKMDEDLSGVCEMFKTPVNERKRKSQVKSGASKTPVGVVEPAVLEPSLLDTPEEPGEMMVSPLTAVSAVKAGRYNKEAVKRLLNDDEESSFMSDVSTLKTDNSSEQQCTKTKTSSVATPKKKPQIPECLTGVKRIMNTPRRNAEPVEDLQGRLLKTPKQKPEQQECLTGVKRIMKTPKPKNEPVEDLRGKLLKTPKQKQEQQECLTGVKRLMRTPRQKTERIKDLKGKLLKTPKRKSEVADISFTGLADLLETPAKISQPEEANTETQKDNTPLDVKRMTKTPKQRSAPVEDMFGIERLMKTPKQRSAPVEDMFGIERLMKTPKERSQPVEENFGIKRLMKSPKLAVNHLQTAECGGQTNVGSDLASAKEFTYAPEQPPIGRGSSKMDVSKGETTKVLVEVPEDLLEPSGAKEVIGQDAVKDETPAVTETDPTDPATSMEPIRGRRTKSVKSKAAHHKPEMAEPSQDPGPVRGRRGRKAEPTEHTRDVVEPAQEETRAAPKPKQRRGAIKVSEQIKMVQEASAETLLEPESEQNLSLAKSRSDAPLEQEPVKSKRGRKPKQESVQSKPEDVAHEGEGGDKLKLIPSKHDENKPSEVEVAVEKDVTTIQKKFVRGRKGKLVEESREVGDRDKQEADFEEAISAPRRSKRTEAIVPRAGRQTTRSKKVKEDPSVAQQEIVGDAEPVTSADTVNASTSSQDEVREPAEESVVKLSRGRRAKLQHAEPLEPQPNKAIDGVIEQAELPAPTSHTQQRGRKLISESADLQELAKGTSKETKQQLKLVTKTRGRKTKQEAEPQDPVKKSRSSRTGEEALVSESEKISPQDPGVAKTRRVGVGKAKQEEANVTCDEFTENQDGSIQTTEKPKRGRRRKQVEDVGTSEVPQETSEQNPQRGRGVKSNSKDDISQIIPAKRARRGAATSSTCKEAIKVEASVTVPSSVSAKRGRRAAAKASPESNATDDSNDAIAEVAKPSQRSVSWKTEVEVHEVPRAATVRALRGRRPRLADQSPSESKNADQTEEDLSEKVEEPQPARRTRRGEKAAEETQPKFRRGRSAKK